MPPQQQNPYEFILNPAKPQRHNPLKSGNFITKIVLIIGGAVTLMIVVGIIVSATSGGGNDANLITVAQQQTELIRVANKGSTTAKTQTARNLAQTIALSVTTSQGNLLTFLGQHGIKTNSKQLALKQSPVTDQKLTAAQNASEFDETFVAVLQDQLKAYQASLKTAFNNTKNVPERQLLSNDFNDTSLLLKQSQAQ